MTMDRTLAKPTLNPRIKQASWVAAGLLIVASLWFGFRPQEGRALRLSGERLAVTPVTLGDFDDFIPVRGRVTPSRTLYLDAIEGGRVEKIHVEDGAFVEEGTLLVDVSNTSLQLDVISREAQVTEQINNLQTQELALERNRLEHARNLVDIDYQITRLGREVDRRRKLVATGTISQADSEATEDEYRYYQEKQRITQESQKSDERLQRAQMSMLTDSVDMLRNNLKVARQNLEGLKIRAPVSGQLTALNAELGQSLARGERLGQIDDPDSFKISAQIDEFYLGRVEVGQSAFLQTGGEAYNLEISKTYPQVNNGQFEVDLFFQSHQPQDIRRGQSLQIRLTLGDSSPALLIPNGAFYQDTGGQWIFVVSADGSRAIKRSIRLGRRNAQSIEVLDGLEEGERVITSPYTSFVDMDRLELSS